MIPGVFEGVQPSYVPAVVPPPPHRQTENGRARPTANSCGSFVPRPATAGAARAPSPGGVLLRPTQSYDGGLVSSSSLVVTGQDGVVPGAAAVTAQPFDPPARSNKPPQPPKRFSNSAHFVAAIRPPSLGTTSTSGQQPPSHPPTNAHSKDFSKGSVDGGPARHPPSRSSSIAEAGAVARNMLGHPPLGGIVSAGRGEAATGSGGSSRRWGSSGDVVLAVGGVPDVGARAAASKRRSERDVVC